MSAVIKSDSATGLRAVRPWPSAAAVTTLESPSPDDAERERLGRRVQKLEDDVRQRDGAMAVLRLEIDEAHQRGKTEGYRSGRAEAESREADRLALLDGAMRNAEIMLRDSLSSLERLSALLARDSLEIILGDPDYRHDVLADVIAKEVAKIEKASLVEISVSAEDFPDKKALQAAAERFGVGAALLVASPDAPSGSCAMTLRLGRQEVGLHQQWGAVRAQLEDLSLPEEPS